MVDNSIVAAVAAIGLLLGFLRWIWTLRAGDLERLQHLEAAAERAQLAADRAQGDITVLRADHREFVVLMRTYQETLSKKPDREEIFQRLDQIPHQVMAMISGNRHRE
jgi:hypothetical protein